MAHDLHIRTPIPSDVSALVLDIRAADREEIIAVNGGRYDLLGPIQEALAISTRAYSAFKGDKLLGIFGVAPYAAINRIGSPWAFGTNECSRAGLFVTKCGRMLINITAREYPHLLNYIDARQTHNIEWLKKLGFYIHDPKPYGVEGRLFHKFELNRSAA